MPFVVRGVAAGRDVWWRKWSGSCVAGRPKWVDRWTINCLFANRAGAQNASASSHWRLFFGANNAPVTNVRIEEVDVV